MVNPAPKTKDSAKLRENGLKWAKKKYESTFEGSTIADDSTNFPSFDYDEVVLGKVLGKGGFGTVSEVRALKVSGVQAANSYHKSTRNIISHPELADEDATVEDGQAESRAFISEHCIRASGDARYALKILSPEVVKEAGKFLQGVLDMAIETRFLSSLEHPNIIKLRALAKCDPFNEKYFIVMDRLYDTLESRLDKWAVRLKKQKGLFRDRSGEKARELYEERIVVAFDLASAVEYLHSKNILYRDIKPENAGFDIRDDVKLFDFGLGKELRESDKNSDGTYKLTGMTGSPRYMAPEVANQENYNHTCDSYSMAILLWQILSCQQPYEMYTMKTLKSKVWKGDHKRPLIDESWNVPMKLLLKRSWGQDLHSRNTVSSICKGLREECVRVRNGNDAGLEHMRRRSTFVFRPKNNAAMKAEVARANIKWQ